MTNYNSIQLEKIENLHIDQFVDCMLGSIAQEITELIQFIKLGNLKSVEQKSYYTTPIISLNRNKHLHLLDYRLQLTTSKIAA